LTNDEEVTANITKIGENMENWCSCK
jgi:hypothetical protein